MVPDPGYLKICRDMCKGGSSPECKFASRVLSRPTAKNVLFIADEIQTGQEPTFIFACMPR